MKVVFVTSESFIDHSYTMAKELRKKIELDVIIIAKELTPEIEFFCKELNAEFYQRKRFINPFSLILENKLMMFIRSKKADLVWFNTFSLAQALMVKTFIKNFIVNIHDIELHPGETDLHGKASHKATFSFYKKIIVVMSKAQRNLFENRFGFKPLLLQLPVIDYYEAAAQNKNNIATKENDIVKFFFFGSVLKYKGFERLLEAAEILEKKKLKFRLNIYGRIKYNTGELEAGIKKIKSITLKNEFIGYKDIFNIYAENDIIVIPYIQVTQCGPLLIGYNQNVPAICSDLPGFREYVDDGKSGLLFDNTARGLAKKMEEIINTPVKINDMSNYIKTEIKNKFSMASLAGNYVSVFEKSAASSR